MASLLNFTSLEFINLKNCPEFDEGYNARKFISRIERLVDSQCIYLNCKVVNLWKDTYETFCEYEWSAIFNSPIDERLTASPFAEENDFSLVSDIISYSGDSFVKFSNSEVRTPNISYVDYFPPLAEPSFEESCFDRSLLSEEFISYLKLIRFRRKRSAYQIFRWWKKRRLFLSMLQEMKELFLLPPMKEGPPLLFRGGPLFREAHQRFYNE